MKYIYRRLLYIKCIFCRRKNFILNVRCKSCKRWLLNKLN